MRAERSGPANLNGAMSGNSVHEAGADKALREGVFDDQEIGAAHSAAAKMAQGHAEQPHVLVTPQAQAFAAMRIGANSGSH